MVKRAERKALEKEGWQSTGDIPFRVARELGINGPSLSMYIPGIVREILKEKGAEYEREHVKRFGERYIFVDAVCYQDIKAKVKVKKKK